jgi:hypothetical protein
MCATQWLARSRYFATVCDESVKLMTHKRESVQRAALKLVPLLATSVTLPNPNPSQNLYPKGGAQVGAAARNIRFLPCRVTFA